MPTLYITKLFECKQKLTGLRAFLEKTSLVAWWLSGVVCRLDRKTVNRRREIRSWNSGAESPERPESETGETDWHTVTVLPSVTALTTEWALAQYSVHSEHGSILLSYKIVRTWRNFWIRPWLQISVSLFNLYWLNQKSALRSQW